MKSTGITRKIDELGRIVIPKEIRKNLGIRDGESLEIFTNEDSIVLKKYSELQTMSDLGNKMVDLINSIYKVNVIITDREKVLATSLKQDLVNKGLESKLIRLIDNRQKFVSSDAICIKIDNEDIVGFITIVPIISSIDSLGLVIVVSDTSDDYDNLAKLIARIMVENISI